MNRRSIFKLIAGAACAAAVEITGLVPALPRAAKYILNPEYISALYEDVYILGQIDPLALRVKRSGSTVNPEDLKLPDIPMSDGAVVVGSPDFLNTLHDRVFKVPDLAIPRYHFINGQYIQVPHYILKA